MKNKIFEYRIIIYVIIGLLLLIMPFILKFPKNILADANTSFALIELKEKMHIEKTFTSEYDGMDYVAIQFATYENKNLKGKIKVTIEDKKNDSIIYKNEIELSEIIDNAQHMFKFKKQKKSGNKSYLISIDVTELRENDKLAIYGSTSQNKKITINDKKENLNYAVTYGCDSKDLQLLMYFPIYLVVIGFIELLKEEN